MGPRIKFYRLPDYIGEQLWRAQNKDALWKGFFHTFANVVYLSDVDTVELESELESESDESE